MDVIIRVYDKDKKIIINDIQKTEHGGAFNSLEGYILDPRFIIMVWSGLYDKEGTQIFDGDILEVNSETVLEKGDRRVRVLVGYKDGCYQYTGGADRGNFNTLLFPIVSKSKVIGNIHMNESALWVSAIIRKPKVKNVKKQKTKKVASPSKKTKTRISK